MIVLPFLEAISYLLKHYFRGLMFFASMMILAGVHVVVLTFLEAIWYLLKHHPGGLLFASLGVVCGFMFLSVKILVCG